MLRPTNAGAATSALFEMKKGAAFLVRQDQQNDAQIFMILFWEKYRCQPEKRRWKRALAERICPKRENARFESGQTLWNSDLHLWFERKNPGLKKPGNGWCAWLFTRRIYTVSLIWRSGRDLNSRAAFDGNTISSRARYDHFDTTAYKMLPQQHGLLYQKSAPCQAKSTKNR